jgi:succinate dehydrogenase / fumarate reductase cytochrome b subunit
MSKLGDCLASSLGKKAVMAATGLLLVGFLIAHLAGNLTLYADRDGAAFDAYCAKLQGFGPLLLVAEVLLALLFGAHVYLGVRLTLENRDARRDGYAFRNSRGRKTLGSSSMFFTGALVLGFLIKHVLDFRFDALFHESPAAAVRASFHQPVTVAIYVVGMAALGLHLSHAFRSAFQSLGIHHPRLVPLLERAGLALAIVLPAGFVSIPLYFFLAG